jgi:hypothetical protein
MESARVHTRKQNIMQDEKNSSHAPARIHQDKGHSRLQETLRCAQEAIDKARKQSPADVSRSDD